MPDSATLCLGLGLVLDPYALGFPACSTLFSTTQLSQRGWTEEANTHECQLAGKLDKFFERGHRVDYDLTFEYLPVKSNQERHLSQWLASLLQKRRKWNRSIALLPMCQSVQRGLPT
ncbi:hypothetical protein AMECASPLE_018558 [Ameca splendens]|uniref:Uncharacterized protein n=1 Tax=Ameca splendens TaxID=208324 RepID=A0ABV0ZZP8_9TELE